MNDNYNTPNSGCCGRPMNYNTTPKCNYNNCCMNEYTYKQKACIRNKQPDCETQAVIPSITVESIEGITNLANCFVHVSDINTTFYVDDKHRVMITWAGPVDIPGYDMENNPNGYRDQIVTDVENETAVIYDKHGNGYLFGITPENLQDAIDSKLDEMATDGTLEDIMAEYAKTKVDYFYIDSTSTSADILSAFASEKSKVIEFETGTYELNADLIISSNTIVNLNGATLTRSSNQWFLGYGRDSEYTDYNGVYNVHFNNGSIELPIALMHNVDISFKNINFLSVNDHAIQMAGCKDIIIDSCVFEGRLINDTISDHFEAVQLESATRAGQPFLNDSDSPSYDSKGNYNVRITNCVFNSGNGTTTKMYTAIGGHSNDENNLYPAENVIIDNCAFQNIWYAQLCPCGFKHSRITNNTFSILNDTGQVQNIRFRYYNDSILIENNTFVGGIQNITNTNSVGYCNGLQIINNTFDTEFTDSLCNVLIANWTNVLIKDNIFKHAKYYSVYAGQNSSYYATDVKIVGNYFKVDNLAYNGQNIYLRYITNVEIYDNTFVKPVTATAGKYSILATAEASNISFANNNIQGTEGVFMSGIQDYTNIYSVPAIAYLSSESAYTPLTNVTPDFALTQFDRLILVIHKNQDPSKHTFAYIDGYTVGRKIGTNNSYSFEVTDGTNSGVVTFTINSDGTFSYTSADSFTLRRVFGVNTY